MAMRSYEDEPLAPYIQRQCLILSEDTPVWAAARAMKNWRAGSAVVTDKKHHILGMVTDRDITCRGVALKADLRDSISSLMSDRNIETISEDQTVCAALRLMEARGVRRIPVVKAGHGSTKCVGVVSLDDLIAAQVVDMDQLAQVVKSQVRRRTLNGRKNARTENRREQKLSKLVKKVSLRSGLKKDLAEDALVLILGDIVQRLTLTEATHFIAQLPQLLQEEMLDLPAGPNRRIDAETVVSEVRELLKSSELEARKVVEQIWQVIKEQVSDGEISHVLWQMPLRIRELLEPSGSLKLLANGRNQEIHGVST